MGRMMEKTLREMVQKEIDHALSKHEGAYSAELFDAYHQISVREERDGQDYVVRTFFFKHRCIADAVDESVRSLNEWFEQWAA